MQVRAIAAAAASLLFATAAVPPLAARPDEPPAVGGVHVPADRRHQGQSRYDRLPFTDHRKGEPDRYRAVNPNYVRKGDDGRFYYLLDARPGTRCFDDAGRDLGPLPAGKPVPVDLARTKDEKGGADGKTVRLVYVRDHGWVSRNALPPAAEVRSGKWFRFPLRPGGRHTLYDGTGIARGTVAASSVRLNYGQRKQIDGAPCYYAFSTAIVPEGETGRRGASGWVRASALADGHDPGYSDEIVAKMQPPPTPAGDTFTAYEVTGGDPEEKLPGGGYRYGYAGADGRFVAYKVLPGVPRTDSVAATDYLKRSDGVINLGFNAAGVSNDTYRVAGPKRPLTFYRSAHPEATVVIDLYHAKDAPDGGLRPVAKMVFVYGYVDEAAPGGAGAGAAGGGAAGAKRWGWMALGALRRK